MLGAIYIGLSGMNAFSRGLQTISNNVANMNSPGYKASTVNFTDAFNVGGLGSAYSGHSNRSQGYGVRFGTPGVDFSQGDMRQSGNGLDLAVQGNGFMVLSEGDRTYYARTGQFAVGDDGYVSLLGSTYNLNVLDPAGRPSALNVDAFRNSTPQATTTVSFRDNLSSGATDKVVSNIDVYDSRGGKQTWTVTFTKDPLVPGDWTVSIKDQAGLPVGSDNTISFDITGALDPDTRTLQIDVAPADAEAMQVTLDFEGVTSHGSGTTSTLAVRSVDGNGVAALTSVSVTEAGHIKLTYANGVTKDMGAVALADFRDPQQLERVGDGLFRGSAQGRLLESGKDGIGRLVSGQLEASNVDLAQQFGDLILVQRGFQASSQVVSVSNDMIQQLFGIRGQG